MEKADKALSDPQCHFGFGWGSDMNGLAEQPGPSPGTPISYPFRSYDGRVTFTREQWGQRTFDLDTDGVANYGMYADWLRDLQSVGGPAMMADMFQGAESYLEMWERADGVPATACLPARQRFSSAGLGSLRLGASSERALFSAGQPLSRPGRSFRYCVAGRTNGRAATIDLFDGRGRTALIASTAPGAVAGAITPRSPARRLSRRARRLMPGLWVGRALHGGARYVYGVKGERVRFVAITTAAQLRSAARLRSDLKAAGV